MAQRNLDCDWKKYYDEHLVTIEEAVKHIEPGDVIFMGQVTMVPYAFLEYLYAHKEDYHDVSFFYDVMGYPSSMLFDHDTKEHFRLMNIYNLPIDRMGIENRTIEVVSAGYEMFSEALFENGVNASATQVCPPDAGGWCNTGAYGVTSNNTSNPDPRIVKKFGFIDATGVFPIPGPAEDNCIHITEFDYIIKNDTEAMELPIPEPTEADKKVASFIMPYIHEGDKVEIGFGGLGEEILRCMNDLPGSFGVYSEVACDSMMPLVESGKITKLVATSPGACTLKFYKWLGETDKDVHMYPRPLCIDPFVAAQQDNLVAINATFMVDLIGQACSEAQGLKPYTGAGGSFAFLYGAPRAKNGRSFLCLRSTYTDKKGELHSNVVPWLPEGSIVTTPKNFIMYVVSEWGCADVFLKTYTDRIKALIKIAHPKFRQWLKDEILKTILIEEWNFRNYDLYDNVAPEDMPEQA